jgi:hypothetical protein
MISSCFQTKNKRIVFGKDEKCLFILKRYSTSWKNDSLGANGFRSIAVFNMREIDCDLIGFSEEDIRTFFGEPNWNLVSDSIEVWRYQLTDYGYYTHPGQEYLDLNVSNEGKISQVRFWKMEG